MNILNSTKFICWYCYEPIKWYQYSIKKMCVNLTSQTEHPVMFHHKCIRKFKKSFENMKKQKELKNV
jgi:hypothetical protein